MKYIRQLCIIMLVSFAGEAVRAILPFPIPASIYGLVIMMVLLMTKLLPLSAVEETADFLVGIMPVMFIPAAVGLMGAWSELRPVLLPVAAILVITTALVMAVTGRVTQLLMKMRKGGR
ncbi:MAG: CidA/LrgA family protein [Clostridia bacterium]|nr:CidA/LrgA family protein [Clostridia bacterium]